MTKKIQKIYNASIKSAIKQGFTKEQAEEFTCAGCGEFGFECKCLCEKCGEQGFNCKCECFEDVEWIEAKHGLPIFDSHEREDVLMK